jgi:hypothetical protein
MKRMLLLAIIFILTAATVEATLPVREKYSVDSAAMVAAAKSSLSDEGVAALQQALGNNTAKDKAIFYSPVFLEPVLRVDLRQNRVKQVEKFLKIISDKRLVRCDVSGGSRGYKGRGNFRVGYALEVSAPGENGENVRVEPTDKRDKGPASAKIYYIHADKYRPGEKRSYGSSKMKIRLEK